MARITIDTRQYRYTHGCQPSGSALWLFERTVTLLDGTQLVQEVSHSGRYSEAAQTLRAVALPANASIVGAWHVCA